MNQDQNQKQNDGNKQKPAFAGTDAEKQKAMPNQGDKPASTEPVDTKKDSSSGDQTRK